MFLWGRVGITNIHANAPMTWHTLQDSGGLVGHRSNKQSTCICWGIHKEWACIDYWVPERGELGRLQSWYLFDLLLSLPFVGYEVDRM